MRHKDRAAIPGRQEQRLMFGSDEDWRCVSCLKCERQWWPDHPGVGGNEWKTPIRPELS